MSQPKNKTFGPKIYLPLTGLVFIIVLALILPNSGLFQASIRNAAPATSAVTCQKLTALSLPDSSVLPGKTEVIVLKTDPENFDGSFSFGADSGSFDDLQENTGSYIESRQKQVTYNGGEADSTITIQAKGAGNEKCIATLPVVAQTLAACSRLTATTDPSPLPENQSASITIRTEPSGFSGTYLIQADSGAFQPANADVEANGINTKTLVTKSQNVLYNGGKSGEKIVVRALGENNSACTANIQIIK